MLAKWTLVIFMFTTLDWKRHSYLGVCSEIYYLLSRVLTIRILTYAYIKWMRMFFLIKNLKGFTVQKMKIRRDEWKGKKEFLSPFKWRVGPFSLPFTKGSRSLNGDNQALEGEWGRNTTSHPTYSSLRKAFLFQFELHFWLARVAIWPPCPSWQDPLHSQL